MKKALILVSFIILLCGGVSARAYHVPVDIEVNGALIRTDSQVFVDDGVTFVPIRFVLEALGYKVYWNGSGGHVSVTDGKTSVDMTIGERQAYVNGKAKRLPQPPVIENNRTYLPVRWICETLGAQVSWSQGYYTVSINKSGVTVPENMHSEKYSKDDIFWLGRIIESESAGEPMDGKIGVGNVILNRVQSNDYPNTIYDVIFDRKHGVQFQPVLNGAIYNTPSNGSLNAAKLSLNGTNTVSSSLFFLNPRIAESFWIVNNRPFYKTIGNHDFYL